MENLRYQTWRFLVYSFFCVHALSKSSLLEFECPTTSATKCKCSENNDTVRCREDPATHFSYITNFWETDWKSTIRDIDVSANHLEFLDKIDSNTFASCKIFNASNNLIISVDSQFGAGFGSMLEILDLSHNKIREQLHVLASADSGWTQLVRANFNYNQIGEFSSTNKKLVLPRMTKLHVAHNLLTSHALTHELYARELLILDVSHNNIEIISQNILKDVNNLQMLDMSNNNILQVQNGAFSHLEKLQKLDLRNNKLKTLFALLATGPKSIWSIYLADNALECSCQLYQHKVQWAARGVILADKATCNGNNRTVDIVTMGGDWCPSENNTTPSLFAAICTQPVRRNNLISAKIVGRSQQSIDFDWELVDEVTQIGQIQWILLLSGNDATKNTGLIDGRKGSRNIATQRETATALLCFNLVSPSSNLNCLIKCEPIDKFSKATGYGSIVTITLLAVIALLICVIILLGLRQCFQQCNRRSKCDLPQPNPNGTSVAFTRTLSSRQTALTELDNISGYSPRSKSVDDLVGKLPSPSEETSYVCPAPHHQSVGNFTSPSNMMPPHNSAFTAPQRSPVAFHSEGNLTDNSFADTPIPRRKLPLPPKDVVGVGLVRPQTADAMYIEATQAPTSPHAYEQDDLYSPIEMPQRTSRY